MTIVIPWSRGFLTLSGIWLSVKFIDKLFRYEILAAQK
jgi:hypothetical protein